MIVFIFFGVVILFSLALNVIHKVRSFNNRSDRSIWQDGDSVIVKKRDAETSGFDHKIDNPLSNN